MPEDEDGPCIAAEKVLKVSLRYARARREIGRDQRECAASSFRGDAIRECIG
jgi:hypothetical protein